MPSVLIVRGHLATPWELRPWLELPQRYEVSYLLTKSNGYAPPAELRATSVRALRDLLPRGPLGEVSAGVLGDRYLSAKEAFAQADVVHAAELSFWFAADAARRRSAGGRFRLVQTVWETLPMLAAYRNRHARRFREQVLAGTDLFLAATERAALALRLEGVAEERIEVCPPGIDIDRFATAAGAAVSAGGDTGAAAAGAGAPAPGAGAPAPGATAPPGGPAEHTIVSPGRLVWEKGHQDVMRALALLHRGVVRPPSREIVKPRLLIVGSGPEEARLRAHAADLGLAQWVEIRSVPYEEMPSVFARASAMVLMSTAAAQAAFHPFDIPHAFWEEQFGLVLAEAMAAGLAIVTTTSGAIPEVVRGTPAELIAPGDWPSLAQVLADGPLSRPAGERVAYPAEVVQRYSTSAAAERLTSAYDRLLAAD
ncbi:MAG TPA: glycosyltransferase family 4 protein [Solirubrobacteraceae bacterium]|nr:glycosyltransferase family 4 protein [Solirubrobacteraceae bacterium]